MKIPASGKRKALIIVDVQEAFLTSESAHVIDSVAAIVKNVSYDLYVDATFDMMNNSLWREQEDWAMPPGSDTTTADKIVAALDGKLRLSVRKNTRSAFKGKPSLKEELAKHGIQEVHIVGLATHDCVIATAFDAFDNGFLTYVLEEGSEANGKDERDSALYVLRSHNMTNNSSLSATEEIEIR